MYRIRLHGGGGQGDKTASGMLGPNLFHAGVEVQDAPRYGAERRGAPIFAYVRADQHPINERGIIVHPDLVVVTDDSLMGVPSAGVLQGITDLTMIFIVSSISAAEWKKRTNTQGRIICLPPPAGDVDLLHNRFLGAYAAGATARLIGGLSFSDVEPAMRKELEGFPADLAEKNIEFSREAYDAVAEFEGQVTQGLSLAVERHMISVWMDIHAESLGQAAPAIHAGATSVQVRTGLWRTLRPVIDYDRCRKCNWICSNYCPDSAISVTADGYPEIDLEHCKGCMICVAQCPPHAIETIIESEARAIEEAQNES